MPKEEIANPTPVATLFYGRKVGLPNYSNEEFSTFLQVALDGVTDNKQLEALLDEQAAFIKAWVCKQLSVPYAVDASTGVVQGEMPVATETPKSKTYSAKGSTTKKPLRTDQPGPNDKSVLWQLLATATKHGEHWKISTGETVWDNRVGKRNPNSPDFKAADSNEGLWLDKAPSWFTGPGEGVGE